MKINLNLFNINFAGQRQDRNNISQLSQNNEYSINEINQRKINQAIERLSQVPGQNNVQFLIDTSQNLHYGTNIELGKRSYNDWKVKLQEAAKSAILKSSKQEQSTLLKQLDSAIEASSGRLKPEEQEILKLRDNIFKKIDQKQLDNLKSNNIKNLKNNLDYFIINSETPLSQKLYILKRLNWLMSEDYKINPQLADKKTQVLAEIVNDIVINTPESKIPNIKAVNQKDHGMCAAISICRKDLAYEDKVNFVDMILSELDASDKLMVYDITNLGSHKKIPCQKTYIDFDYAMKKGYRIIDASALQWMNVAHTTGATNEQLGTYKAFDKLYFDTFADSHWTPELDEQNLPLQNYYKSLLVADKALTDTKKDIIKNKYFKKEQKISQSDKIEQIAKYDTLLKETISKSNPTIDKSKVMELSRGLRTLSQKDLYDKTHCSYPYKEFLFILNEPQQIKMKKIKAFISYISKDFNTEDMDIEQILDILTDINSLEKGNATKSNVASKVNEAIQLYKAAATYRTQMEYQLELQNYVNQAMLKFNIPDREALLTNNIDELISKITKNTIDPIVMTELMGRFENVNNKEDLLNALSEIKVAVSELIPQGIDEIYQKCLLPSRKNILLSEIEANEQALNTIEKTNDLIKYLADKMKLPANKKTILKTLKKYEEVLSSPDCSEEEYNAIYNLMGNKNHLLDFKTNYENIMQLLFGDNENKYELQEEFKKVNGLSENATEQDVWNAYVSLGQSFDNFSLFIANMQRLLYVADEDDNVINSPVAKDAVLKAMEKRGIIVKSQDLKALQNKFNEIDRALDHPNGQILRLKDLPAKVTTFSNSEKETLKQISKNINYWQNDVSSNLQKTYKQLKEPLSEMHRQLGVKTGQHWVGKDGHSGLNSTNEVRIIEQMTDRPYYIELNIKRAIGKIKKSPYSGITSTSVSDKEVGGHAQYLVDIKPVTIHTPNGDTVEDAIFHDNTWGISEGTNVWKDNDGLLRTDYDNGYGGELGYITDNKYRNGNILKNLLTKYGVNSNPEINSKVYKKLSKNEQEQDYKFPLIYDIITPGQAPNADSYVSMIKDNLLMPPLGHYDDFIKLASKMTKDEILETINKAKTLGENIEAQYNSIDKRIWGTENFDRKDKFSQIKTQQDYDRFDDNDDLKILLDKIAIQSSYQLIPENNLFYNKATHQDLIKLKELVKKEAVSNFEYAFAKNPDIVIYGYKEAQADISKTIEDYAKNENILISTKQINDIVKTLKNIDTKQFDGSLDNTIDLMTSSMPKQLSVYFDKNQTQHLVDLTKDLLKQKMYLNLGDVSDMDKHSGRYNSIEYKHILNWIDNTFDPATNEDFVRIFNNLQNMTKEEFYKQYGDKISDKDLGIKDITGFDILTKYKAQQENIDNKIFNMLYFEEMSAVTKTSETEPYYRYEKINKKIKGATYVDNKISFDDLYLEYYYSLLSLHLKSRYNKLKEKAYQQYQLFPAYPTEEYENQEISLKGLQNLYDRLGTLVDDIENFDILKSSIHVLNNLQKYVDKLDENQPLSQYQKTHIIKYLKYFYVQNNQTDELQDIMQEICAILQNPDAVSTKTYKEITDKINAKLSVYFEGITDKTIRSSIETKQQEIDNLKKEFIINSLDPKYQAKGYEILNDFISAVRKHKQGIADNYFEDFCKLYDKHKIINAPEKILNEYLLLIAKQPANSNNPSNLSDEQIEELKDLYGSHVRNLILISNGIELQEILMACTQKANLNIVKKELQNTKLELIDGTYAPFDEKHLAAYLLNSIVAQADKQTTARFINQLGLGENIVNILAGDTDFKDVYKAVNREYNIYRAINKQMSAIQEEIKLLEDKYSGKILDDKFLKDLELCKQNILQKCKKTQFRRVTPEIDEVLTELVKEMSDNIQDKHIEFIEGAPEAIKTVIMSEAHSEISDLSQLVKQYCNSSDLLQLVKLQPDSETEKQRQEFLDGVSKLLEYQQNLFSTIDLDAV